MADTEEIIQSMVQYVNYGFPTGSYTEAVLANDLREALGNTDGTSHLSIWEQVAFLQNHAPMNCWGSYERVREWQKAGGLQGKGYALIPDDPWHMNLYTMDRLARNFYHSQSREVKELYRKNWEKAHGDLTPGVPL